MPAINSTIITAFICLIAIIIYIWHCFKSNTPKTPSLGEMVIIILCCSGIIAGIQLITLFFDEALMNNFPKEIPAIYILVGGVSVVWVSVVSILKTYGYMKAN